MFFEKIVECSNKINTKEELIEILKRYKSILNASSIEYLNSLLNLEFSAISNNIDLETKKALSEIMIYKKIARYNIYTDAVNIYKKVKNDYDIFYKNDNINGLVIYNRDKKKNMKIYVFNYLYNSNYLNPSHLYEGFVPENIGIISLFQTIENEELYDEEVRRIRRILTDNYLKDNPYDSSQPVEKREWYSNNLKAIKDYNKLYEKISTEYEKDEKEIELKNYINSLFLESYNLKENDFVNDGIIPNSLPNCCNTRLNKTMVKVLPRIEICKNIKIVK